MPHPDAPQPGTRFETDFRLIREARHLTIDQVHRRTMLQPETLEAFENTGLLNNPVFANNTYRRAFVKNYAQAVGVRPDDALHGLDEAIAGTYKGSLAAKYLNIEPATVSATVSTDSAHEHREEPQAEWGAELFAESMTDEAPVDRPEPEAPPEPVLNFDPEATTPIYEPPILPQAGTSSPSDPSPYAPPEMRQQSGDTPQYYDSPDLNAAPPAQESAPPPEPEPAEPPRYYEPPDLEATAPIMAPRVAPSTAAAGQGRHFEPPPLEGLAKRADTQKRIWRLLGLAVSAIVVIGLLGLAWMYWTPSGADTGSALDDVPLVGVSPDDLPKRFSGFIRPASGEEQFVSLRIRSTDAIQNTFDYTLWTVDAGKMFSQEGIGEFNDARDRLRLSAEHGWGGIFKARDGTFVLRSLGENATSQWELKGG